jgi:CheY-like chemotaxis protein
MNILNDTSEELPSIIFLDLNMPRKTGKECLAEIRKNPRFKSIPVIIYSTSSHKRDIQETHSCGANLYMPKPNSFTGLVDVVTKVFSIDLEQLRTTPPIDQFVLSEEMI